MKNPIAISRSIPRFLKNPLESSQIQQYRHTFYFVDAKNKERECLSHYFYPQHLAQCLAQRKHAVDICWMSAWALAC